MPASILSALYSTFFQAFSEVKCANRFCRIAHPGPSPSGGVYRTPRGLRLSPQHQATMNTDIEKSPPDTSTSSTTNTIATSVDDHTYTKSTSGPMNELPPPANSKSPAGAFPSLRPTLTNKSHVSAIRAAQTLSDFESSPDNPRNWPLGKKWKITLTIALTGFISTCGSSIAVPGIHAISAEFGVTNPKVAILNLAMYVLGMG